MSNRKISNNFRTEKDMLGEKKISMEYYYGINTQRALENFPVSHYKLSDFPEFIKALICIKKSAAYANYKLNLLNEDTYTAIETTCDKIISNRLWKHFPVDMFQGGGGTSVNMNVNEVIANIAGEAKIHPLEHVNLGQSTNDVYPSAIKIVLFNMTTDLIPPLRDLVHTLENKEKEFSTVVKLGRTCLQDAVPITLGQEFSGYRCLINRVTSNLEEELSSMQKLNMGGTAVGTGIGCKTNFGQYLVEYLNKITDSNFMIAENLFDATQNCDTLLALSGKLKNAALALSKIANDLRLLSSGPDAGLSEIILPAVQAGSSIMPGKVNPVMPELINQIAYRICGNDTTVSMALERGELELNIMEPVIALCLMESIQILKNGTEVFNEKCIRGIKANKAVCRKYAGSTIAVYTLLSNKLGYSKVSELIKEAKSDETDIKKLVLKKRLLTKSELDDCLNIK